MAKLILTFSRLCSMCGEFCDHKSKMSGDFETITCSECGHSITRKVK